MGRRSRPAQPVRVGERQADGAKGELLLQHFGSQRSKDWFSAGTFMALARLRGNEARAPEGFAEAFHVRKLVLGSGARGAS